MTTTKSSGTVNAFIIPQPKQFHRIASKKGRVGDNPSPVFMDSASPGVLDSFAEKFRSTGIDVGREDSHELKVLEQFLVHHVKVNRIYDIQCMLLWSEWVRTCRRSTLGYPKLILEKEFSDIITDNFGVKITNYSTRGAVYSGIKFIP